MANAWSQCRMEISTCGHTFTEHKNYSCTCVSGDIRLNGLERKNLDAGALTIGCVQSGRPQGGYIRVFNRMHCVFDLSDRTRNVFYCDTIPLLGGNTAEHEKSRRAGKALRPIRSDLWSLRWLHKHIAIERNFATGLYLVNIHDFVVIAFRYTFNINHHSAFDMNLYRVHGSEFNFYILPLAERRLMCSVSSRSTAPPQQ